MAEQDRKFVATDTSDDVALANPANQQPSDLDQCFVPGLVPEAVVDQLKAVEVDEQDRRFLLITTDPIDQPLERAHESAPVWKLDETVLVRQQIELLDAL